MKEPMPFGPLNRREFLARSVVVAGLPRIAMAAVIPDGSPPGAAGPGRLQMFTEGYPRSFFWWTTCRQLHDRGTPPEQMERILTQLQGFACPCIYWDELAGIKARHPEKLVFLFTQGYVFSEKPTIFDPIDRSKLFAGHWVHYEGCRITGEVSAAAGECDIPVGDPERFGINTDGGRKFPDDVCLCGLTPEGRPDWHRAEQVKLVSTDAGRKVIRVLRGQYGTRPIALPSGQAWAMAHASEPWGHEDGASWVVNYSPFCPKDARARTAADILLEDFASLFARGGPLAHYDGLEFDVMPFDAGSRTLGRKGREVDTDGDGLADRGYRDGANVYGIGFRRFAEALRARIGPTRLFMADGNTHTPAGAQRCFGVLNGIESEWWPRWGDMDVTLWSYGMNLHRFWNRHAHAVPFSYFIGKFGGHDRKKFLSVPWKHHRLVMAAAQLVDAAFTSFYTPEPEPGEVVGLWDEMVAGTARRTGWLGQPLGPPVHLAHRTPDLLSGAGVAWAAGLVARFHGQDMTFATDGAGLGVSSRHGAARLDFHLADVPCRRGEDLLVAVKLKAAPRPDYPSATPRLLRVEADAKSDAAVECFVGSEWFETTLYFRNLPSDRVTLRFALEGSGPLWLSELSVHAHPDVALRIFEKGIVLANPGDRPFTFELAGLQTDRRYRRIQGSPRQDPRTNDGSPVDGTVTLAGRDGLFLAVDGIRPGG